MDRGGEIQLPCDADDVCMRCKSKIPSEECLTCSTCVTPWHVSCLRSPPATLASTQSWECPDCSGDVDPAPASGLNPNSSSLVAAIRAIEADASLNEAQKAKKRQQLVSGKAVEEEDEEKEKKEEQQSDDFLVSLRKNVSCSICLQLPERPVTVRVSSSVSSIDSIDTELTIIVNVKFIDCM